MQPVPQDLLKEYVQSQHFTSTTEIMAAMKEMFRDVIQTVMEVEMDEELGRERCERSDEPEGTPRNYRNGYTKKTVKTQLGEVDIKVPRDRNGSFEPKICDTLAAILKAAKTEQHKNRFKYGELYSLNYYKQVQEKGRSYYELYSLQRS